jgi:pyruvate dehydrogenase E1 component alpha subunit
VVVALIAVPALTARVRSSARSSEDDSVTSRDVEARAGEETQERQAEEPAEQQDGKPGAAAAMDTSQFGDDHSLPDRETCEQVLRKMMLIRRFEERAGEMYAKAKIGGFLHLCIGEEATVVGTVNAMRDEDYLMSTYREHGQALARGTPAGEVMAELFGRVDGCSGGRGGSMHLFDYGRRFLGGYGIVGGNLPLAAGVGLAADYMETEDVCVCMFGDGASNQGTFGETMNLVALWDLPVVFVVVNNQFGMGTALERHSAVTDLSKKSEGFGVPGTRCDGMDVLDVHSCVTEAIRKAREDRQPNLVECLTYRFRGHSMADPEEYRTKEEVEEWRGRDPIESFKRRLVEEDVVSEEDAEKFDEEAIAEVDEAVRLADQSPFPDLDSLYDDIYVYGDQVPGWYSVDERSPEPHPGERERESGVIAHELAEAGAAYAGVGDERARKRRQDTDGEEADPEAEAAGEGEQSGEAPEEEGGAD